MTMKLVKIKKLKKILSKENGFKGFYLHFVQ